MTSQEQWKQGRAARGALALALVAVVSGVLILTQAHRLASSASSGLKALGGGHHRPPPAASVARPRGPNIVLILTDDQRWDTLWAMPHVQSLLVRHGVQFTNGFVVNPLCCPSRTSILTGQYSHTTGVYTNAPPHGGFPAFHEDRSTAATWLQAAGYRTALIGKYLNDYRGAALTGYVPPGWDRWVSFAEWGGRYYDYNLTIDGHIRHYGSLPQDYSTGVLTRYAVRFIERTRRPFFLYYAPPGPHGPFTPAPRDLHAFRNLPRWHPPSYGEKDVSDKPPYVRSTGWGARRSAATQWIRRQQYRDLLSVDRGVGRILGALARTDRLRKTFVVFMSDNGFLWGEHRLNDKNAPYEESIRVPMVVRYDPMTRGAARRDRHLVLNVDLAPTFAALGHVQAPGSEGRSLLPLVRGRQPPWRTKFLIEHLYQQGEAQIPSYCALRKRWSVYVLYDTGFQELYDLRSDPYELRNLAGQPGEAVRVAQMRLALDSLCRPRPPGWPPGL